MSLPFLESLGLTKNESDLYELLLKKGEVPVGEIISETKLPRATAYKVLEGLAKKGLVTQRDFAKKIHVRPEPPSRLLTLTEDKFTSLERAREDVRKFLPELTSMFTMSVERPVVSSYEGIKGIKAIYEDTLRVGKPIYALLQAEEIEPELRSWIRESYVPRRARQKIPAFVILSSGEKAKDYVERNPKSHRFAVVVPKEKYKFEHEVDIYGDKVAFINYKAGTSLLGIVIEHPLIATTVKTWFDLAWVGAGGPQEMLSSTGFEAGGGLALAK